jgi:hypothetical protein
VEGQPQHSNKVGQAEYDLCLNGSEFDVGTRARVGRVFLVRGGLRIMRWDEVPMAMVVMDFCAVLVPTISVLYVVCR